MHKLHWQFNKMFWGATITNKQEFHCSTCSKCPPRYHQHAHTVAPLVNRSLDDVLSTIIPSLHQAFLQVTDVTNLCFIHALLHNTPNFIIYRSILMKDNTIYFMQFSLVISHCNITFSLFRLSQGSEATLIRWGGWSSHRHVYRPSLNLTVKLH